MDTNNVKLPLAALAQHSNPESTSDKYSFIPTTRVMAVLENEGWNPVSGLSVKPRTKNPLYVRHAVEFEHPTLSALSNDERFRITVVNSHDGSSSFRFYSGLMRIICSNGLVAGRSFETFRVRHVGYTDSAVKEALNYTLEQAPKISSVVVAMKNTDLTMDVRCQFYDAIIRELELYSRLNPNYMADIYRQLECARRREDKGTDLWTVFNRVQEHVVRGGLIGISKDKHGNLVPRRLRAIKAIKRQFDVNRKLWDTAESFIAA